MCGCIIRVTVLGLALGLAGSSSAVAAGREFDFKDPKGVNSMTFVLDSLLEPMMGLATGISGKVTYDPDTPETITGKIVVDAKKLHMQHPGMQKKLQEADWLDVETYPEIAFTFKKIREVKSLAGGAVEMVVTGDFTLKGITRAITVPVRVTHLPGRLPDRLHRGKGDLLVLRADFSIKRTSYGIKVGMGDEVVADKIDIRMSIVGMAPSE